MNPEQWLSLKWNGGSTMSDRWLNQSKIIQKATTKEFKNNKNNYFAVVFSFTEIAFYLPLIIVCTIVIKNIFCYC